MGAIAFVMNLVEQLLSLAFVAVMETQIINNLNGSMWDKYYAPWLIFGCLSGCSGLIASLMTTYYGPGASGSGVAEFIGYLNGVNNDNFITINSLVTKIVGVPLSVSGKLCVGKEGPLAHIGAVVGIGVIYIPKLGFEFMRNEEIRRQLAAAGASAGVSCAYGAPIGGTLFAYEQSKPNTFWRFTMIWKVFISCSVATFFLALLQNTYQGNLKGNWAGSTLKFGNNTGLIDINTLYLMPGAIVLGLTGGLLGSLFLIVNGFMNDVVRKKCLTKNWHKPVETFFWCFATASVFYWFSLFSDCEDYHVNPKDPFDSLSQIHSAWCENPYNEDNERSKSINTLATLFWNTEGGVIRVLLN